MYEKITHEVLLERMLDRVDSNIDTREGSMMYNSQAPASVELQNMYIEADYIMNETFVDTASRENLIKRAKERGLFPLAATKAILKGVFTPSSLELPIGTRFSLEKLNYIIVEKISEGQYELECETPGIEGNANFGTLIPIDYVHGLATAVLTELLIPGENEEDTETFRKRYFNSLNAEAFGGNKADYKAKVSLLNGVGGVKVYSGTEWNGGGTVKIVITDSKYEKPSKTLIDTVQTAIDPVTNHGEGIGIAPIGHVVTVAGVNEQKANIRTMISYQPGYAWDDVKTSVEEMIDSYFHELNKNWENEKNIVLRISQVETRLLGITGIIDVRDTKINGVEENCTIEKDAIIKRGEVTDG